MINLSELRTSIKEALEQGDIEELLPKEKDRQTVQEAILDRICQDFDILDDTDSEDVDDEDDETEEEE